MGDLEFQLQFPPEQIVTYAKRYSFEDDLSALEAGQNISKGDCTRVNLETIYEWKTRGRGRGRLQQNSERDICDALKIATMAQTERAAISVLIGLDGVDVPVASAILTAINPEKYTIIDFRALQALGQSTKDRSVKYYLRYLSACRELARKHNTTLRQLDRALWQWSRERGERKKRS